MLLFATTFLYLACGEIVAHATNLTERPTKQFIGEAFPVATDKGR